MLVLAGLLGCAAGVTPAAGTAVLPDSTGGTRTVDTLPGQVVRGTHVFGALSREWRLYLPSGNTNAPRPLLVLLHGCTQDADDIARGTRAEAFAERAGMLVLTPQQPVSAHPQKCWNWYAPAHQSRDSGEVGLLASLVQEVVQSHGVNASRVHVAGMSAGGAMAQLLATAYPERFASVTVASGVPVGAASTVPDALRAMREGPAQGDVSAQAVLSRMGERARAIPLLVLHGATDAVVSPKNADALALQWQQVLSRLGVQLESGSGEERGLQSWRDSEGELWLRTWRIPAVGHAWSGGDPAGTYVDPQGPDATAALFEFLGSR